MRALLLLIMLATIFLGFGLGPAHADSAEVQILDVHVEPSTLKVNDTFLISATILNSSPYPIYLTSGSCTPAFLVSFDIHAKQVYPNIACTTEAIIQKVDPLGETTITNANKPGIIYETVLAGTANANITIPYFAKNQTSTDYSNIDYKISKSFQFTIRDNNTNISIPHHDVPPVPSLLTPLKQFKSGVLAKDITCNQGLKLILKAEDGSPACVKPESVSKLLIRGWATLSLKDFGYNPGRGPVTLTNALENSCEQFHPAPESRNSTTVPVLLMNSNSTACTRLTFTIVSNYKDCNGLTCQGIIEFNSTLSIGNLHYEKHDNLFSVSAGKDFTNSFQVTAVPQNVDLENFPIGSNFTVTYIIRSLSNATGFYDQSIPKLACERYPLAVGYTADQVNYSNFSYIDPLNPPCASAGVYNLTAVEISGMSYKEVALP